MNKLLGFIGMTVGGWIGWAIGARISFGVALTLSIVGTGVGLYAARRYFSENF